MSVRKNNGDGCVTKVKDGKWRASIYIGKQENGKPLRKQFTARTEAEVKRKLKEYKKNMGLQPLTQLKKYTVSEYFDFWLMLKEQELKPLSYKRIKSTVETFIKPELGFMQFATVDTADIQKLINKYQKEKSYSTIKKIFNALNALYKYDLGLPPTKRIAQYNPCQNVIINKQSTKTVNKIKTLTSEQVKLLKKEIKRTDDKENLIYPYGSIYLLMLNTGCRMGEILALNKSDVDISKRTLTINKNAVQVDSDVIIQDNPKTFSGNRIINLNNGAFEAVQTLFEMFPDTIYLALNNIGSRVSPQNCNKTFKQILKQCGIVEKGLNCHALRHTFASMLFEKGVDVKIVSEILGHSSTTITYNTYISVIQKQKAEAVNLIPNL